MTSVPEVSFVSGPNQEGKPQTKWVSQAEQERWLCPKKQKKWTKKSYSDCNVSALISRGFDFISHLKQQDRKPFTWFKLKKQFKLTVFFSSKQ